MKLATRGLRAIGMGLLALVLFVLGYETGLTTSGNLHVVEPGEAYRSAQPTAGRIAWMHGQLGIRSIINLRGENAGSDWYDAELATSRRLGITHIDYRMSSRDHFDQARAEELIALMRAAPKPVLIHCNGGADRSGLASALYLGAISQRGHMAAEMQLSPLFGHMPIAFLRAFPMTESFEGLEGWMGLSDD
jgi:protein tyrosine/serine phosphatase